jgi:diacylglycerol kinase family enzyme
MLQLDFADAERSFDRVIVCGGDGTLNAVLPPLAGSGIAVGFLPIGTLNLLARDLGFTGEIESDIGTLVTGEAVTIDLCSCNGQLFHTKCGIGLTVTMAEERREARRAITFSKTMSFLVAATRTAWRWRPLSVEVETETGSVTLRVAAVLVTNNRFDGSPPRRASLADGVLELALIEAGPLSARVRLLWSLWSGDWRRHSSVRLIQSRNATIRRLRRQQLTASLDGEIRKFDLPLEVKVLAQALTVYAAPRDGQ